MDAYTELVGRLEHLRKGLGARHPDLVERFGLRGWLLLGVTDENLTLGQAQEALRESIVQYLRDQPDDQVAMQAALGLHAATSRLDTLQEREQWLGTCLGVSSRTARRRVKDATERLARTATASQRTLSAASSRGPASRVGHVLERLGTEVRLVGDRLSSITEERAIRVIEKQDAIVCRVGAPPGLRGVGPEHGFEISVEGGQLRPARLDSGIITYEVEPWARPLGEGDRCRLKVRYELAAGLRMAPYYLAYPVTPFEKLDLTIAFDPTRRPSLVRRVSDLLFPEVDSCLERGEELSLDASGYVRQSFDSMPLGRAYGVAWGWGSARG